MRSLAPAIRDLLRRLFRSWDTSGPSPTSDATDDALKRIGEFTEPAAVPSLVHILFSEAPRASEMAAGAIQQIVGRCTPLALAQLDKAVRHVDDRRITPRDVVPLSYGLVGTLGVLSFHGSGYVRETALQALAKVQSGEELPFLLIRLNDWVREVRDLARHLLLERIRPDYAPHFVRNLPLVYLLGNQHRDDHRQLLDRVRGLLQSEECRPALQRAMDSTDRQTRRLAFRMLLDTTETGQVKWLEDVLGHGDSVLRLWAAQELRKRVKGEDLRQVLVRLAGDPFVPVYREALYGFAEQLPAESEPWLTAALFDKHASIREVARFYLRKEGSADFAAIYRERLKTTPGDKGVVAGLGETGGTDDAAVLADYLSHRSAAVRQACLRAIGRLEPEGYQQAILNALGDAAPSVAKTARDIVLLNWHWIAPPQLWIMFQDARDPQQQLIILSIMAHLRWWDSAWLLVRAVGNSTDQVRAAAVNHLWQWERQRNRLASPPTREQARLLDEAIAQHGTLLESGLRDDIAALLSYAKREYLGVR